MSPKSKGRRPSRGRSRSSSQRRARDTGAPKWLAPAAVIAVVVVAVGLIVLVATRPSTKQAARQADTVAAGRKVYVAHCAVCHGRQGDGSSMGPPIFTGELAALPDDSYRQAIASGVPSKRPQYGAMPPQQVSASDAAKVIAYVRNAQATGQP